MRRVRLIAMAVGAAGLLLATACGSGGSSQESRRASAESVSAGERGASTNIVHLPKSYKFDPASIEIEAGDEVTWVNEDDFPHTVQTLDDNVDRKLGVGKSVSITFSEPGTYKYNCSLHPTQMKGQVVVKPA